MWLTVFYKWQKKKFIGIIWTFVIVPTYQNKNNFNNMIALGLYKKQTESSQKI